MGVADSIMSVKHRYTRPRSPGKGPRGPSQKPVTGPTPAPRLGGGVEEKCSCWVLLRGEESQPMDPLTADCELVPDPSCPVHGKKRYPIIDDEDWGP